MRKKSSLIKLSNAYLFQQFKADLPPSRKFSQVEIRLILKQNRDRLFSDTNTQDFRKFLTLAREAYEREDYNEGFIQINKTLQLFCKSSASQKNPNKLDRARIYELAGKIYKKNYKIQGSISFLERSFRIFRKTLGEDNIYSVSVILELVESYLENFMGNKAIFYIRKYLNMKETQSRRTEEISINALYVLSIAYIYWGGPKIGLTFLKQVLRDSSYSVQKDNEIEFEILWKIGKIYSDIRKIEKAKKYYMKSFIIVMDSSFKNKISITKIYNFLSDYYSIKENYDLSLYYGKRSIEFLKQSKEDTFLEIARKYRNMAEIYHNKNDREKWLYYKGKHMILLQKTVGPRHPEFLNCLIEYSHILLLRGLYRKCLKLLKYTKRELKIVFKFNIYLKAYYKFYKGMAYLMLNRTKKALNKLKEARKLFFEYFGENHPNHIACYFLIGSVFHILEDFDKALVIYKRTFEMYQRIYSYFSFSCVSVFSGIAAAYKDKGNAFSSLKHYKRCLHILKRLKLRKTYETKLIYLDIAQLYLKTYKKQHFFYFLKTALKLKTNSQIAKHEWRYKLLDVLHSYFCDIGQIEKAKKLCMKHLNLHLSSNQYNLFRTINIIHALAMNGFSLDKKNFFKVSKLFVIAKQLYNTLIEKDYIQKDNPLRIRIYMIKAELYKSLGKHEEYLNTLRTVLNLKSQLYKKYHRQMLEIYMKISCNYLKTKTYDKYLQITKRALIIELKTFKDPSILSRLYAGIASTNLYLKKFDVAIKYMKKSYKINNCIETNIETLKINKFSFGFCYFQQNQFDKALEWFIKGLSNTDISKHMSLADTCFWNSIAITNVSCKLDQKALGILKVCIDNAIANKFDNHIVEVFVYHFRMIEKIKEMRRELTTKDDYNGQLNPEVYLSYLVHFIQF